MLDFNFSRLVFPLCSPAVDFVNVSMQCSVNPVLIISVRGERISFIIFLIFFYYKIVSVFLYYSICFLFVFFTLIFPFLSSFP